MELSAEQRRSAFVWWLRTGRLPSARGADGLEFKFNPYHDPANGRFTFGPGGGSAGSRGVISTGTLARSGVPGTAAASSGHNNASPFRAVTRHDLGPTAPQAMLAASEEESRNRGSNARAFEDPMTVEQAFPGLRDSPAGAVFAVADNLFDLTGPANDAQTEIIHNRSMQVIREIKALNPHWDYDAFASQTLQGQTNALNNLRFDRAVEYMRVKGDLGPLKVETLRFVQNSADQAYDDGMELLQEGKLNIRLSQQEALGNYVDQRVRSELRQRYNRYGIDSAGKGPVRVNRRENDNSGTDLSYRRPDARVGDVAFDVTIARKTSRTPQVRGFFSTDFRPSSVIIIRPRQLGSDYTYVISRPEAKR